MKISSDKLYFVDFDNGAGKHLAVGEEGVADLLVEEMDDPHQFYADVLEESPENVEDPTIIELESVSDLLDMDPSFQHKWTYRLLPTARLFFEDSEDEGE